MSALSDLFHGNFGNIGHDLTSHFKEDLPYYLLAGTALTGGLGLAGVGPAAGLFGAEAAGAGLFGAEAAGAGLGVEAGLGAESAVTPLLGEASTYTAETAATEVLPQVAESGLPTEFSSAAKSSTDPLFAQSAMQSAPTAPTDPLTSLSGPLTPDKAAGGGGEGFMDKLWSGAKSSITNNPLSVAAAAGGLGMTMFGGNKNSAELNALKEQAGQLGQQGAWLQQYLKDGTLPPGMKAQLDQATQAAKARIISNHAKSGMPSDPSMNSALAQELNSVDVNAVAAMAQTQMDMYKTGLNETGLSSQLYQYLVKLDREDNKELMNSIAKFAAALGGGGGKGKNNTFSIVST